MEHGVREALRELREHNARLERKIRRLEREKAMWELRCKWTWWHLETLDHPQVRHILSELKRTLRERLEGRPGNRSL